MSYDCSEFDPACEGASHCWPFATVRVPWQHMDRSQARATRAVLAGAGRSSQPIGNAGRAIVLSSRSSINVSSWNPREQNAGCCVERLYFRLWPCREADRRVYAVRRGVRGAMRMCGAARVCARVHAAGEDSPAAHHHFRRVLQSSSQKACVAQAASKSSTTPKSCRQQACSPQGCRSQKRRCQRRQQQACRARHDRHRRCHRCPGHPGDGRTAPCRATLPLVGQKAELRLCGRNSDELPHHPEQCR